MNAWIQHIKNYQKKHKCSYKEAMTQAKHTYKKSGGGGQQSSESETGLPHVLEDDDGFQDDNQHFDIRSTEDLPLAYFFNFVKTHNIERDAYNRRSPFHARAYDVMIHYQRLVNMLNDHQSGTGQHSDKEFKRMIHRLHQAIEDYKTTPQVARVLTNDIIARHENGNLDGLPNARRLGEKKRN
jgi:hypothetical protein